MSQKSLSSLLFFLLLMAGSPLLAQMGMDTSGPVFTNFPASVLEYCESADYEAWLQEQRDFVMAVDTGCGLFSITDDAPAEYNETCGQLFVIFTAADSCGNESFWGVFYEVRDTLPPAFGPIPDTLTAPCQAVPPPGLPPLSDNCDTSLTTIFEEMILPGSCPNEETRLRRWITTDKCNLSDTIEQVLLVIDTTPPALIGIPADTTVDCSALPPPPLIGSDIIAQDSCPATLTVDFEEISTQHPNPDSCGHYQYSLLRRWTAEDECGNVRVDSQLIQVIDTTPPTLLVPPDITVDCEFVNLLDSTGQASVQENCDTNPSLTFTDVLLVGSCPQQYTIQRQWMAADACGNADSALQIISVQDTFAPLILQPAQSVTLDCQNGLNADSAFMAWVDSLGFAAGKDNCGLITWFAAVPGSYDLDDPATFPGLPPGSLDTLPCPGPQAGLLSEETVDFVAFDECGNASVTSATFRLVDNAPPLITACASYTTLPTLPDSCNAEYDLLLPQAQDDCSPVSYAYSLDGGDTLSVNDPPGITLSLEQGNHQLTFFMSDCSGNVDACVQNISVEDNQPPAIACPADLSVSFPPGQSCSLGLFVTLPYPTLSDNCGLSSALYFSQGATVLSNLLPLPGDSLTLLLNPGTTEIFFAVFDQNSLSDTCRTEITLLDDVPPTAICQPVEVEVNPSGVDDYILQSAELDAGSFDNCAIVDYSLSQDTFSCEQAGSTFPVTLTVTDIQGNTDDCVSLVKVSTLPPQPSYLAGLCGGDTLELFTNPPASSLPNNIAYDYAWSGPQSFSSSLENPIRPSVTELSSGTYSVTITGTTGCTAAGTVEVIITDQPAPPVLQPADDKICIGQPLLLQTTPYTGSNVQYCWYQSINGQDSLIATTSLPELLLTNLPPGNSTYFLEVKRNNCASGFSAPRTVEVVVPPIALTNEAVIERCAGESFSLGTPVQGPGLTYLWTGPGFSSSLPNPPALTNIIPAQSGTYELVIFRDGCPSEPAITEVIITPLPPQPDIATNSPVCEGDELVLFTDLSDGELYSWQAPNLGTLTTTGPVLSLPDASLNNNGSWELFVTVNGCESPLSESIDILVEPIPIIEATNDGPGCEGQTVQLAASDFPTAAYLWAGPSGFQSAQKDPVVDAVPGWYVVTASTPNGCTDLDSTLVAVSSPPNITGGSSAPSGCVDGEQDVILTAMIFPPDDGSYTYTWNGPGVFTPADEQAVIPNATSGNNGPYTLVVTDSVGCASDPFTITVDLIDEPATPALQPAGPLERCAGASVTFSVATPYDGTVSYIWSTPSGNVSTGIPSLTINNLQPDIHSGIYSLFVIRNGCTSNPSAEVQLTVHPIPDAPVAGVEDDEVCPGDTILLFTDFQAGLSYEWTGPAGFSANTANPVRFPALPIYEGSYAVRVVENGCASAFSPFVSVEVLELPQKPAAQNTGPVCVDAPGAEFSLQVSGSTATQGATYRWFEANTDTLLGGPTPALGLLVDELDAFGAGSFSFYVIATSADGCVSEPSNPTTVQLDFIPAIMAFAGDDLALCEENSVGLNAEAPDPGSGQWSQLSGPPLMINNPELPNTNISGLQAGEAYTLLWTLSNGACTDYSADSVSVRVDAFNETAEAGPLVSLCDSSLAQLQATPSAFGNEGSWSQSPEQAAQGITIDDPEDPATPVSGLLPGNTYAFTWSLANEGCGVISTDAVQVQVGNASENAFAGADVEVCEEGDATLNAQPPQRSEGQWTALAPGAVISSPFSPSTDISGLMSGENLFVWSLTNPSCPVFSRDTVSIFFDPLPQASDDLVMTPFGATIEIDVLGNDFLPPSGFEISLVESPAFGEVQQVGVGRWEYDPRSNFFGEDIFYYEICSVICPGQCSEAAVRIRVEEGNDCTPPTIITPNNDGINDAFIVPCLSSGDFPNNTVIIFNQWGDELFRAAPYNNDWEGTYNGQVLPASTYFYQINYGDGREPAAGFLMIER